MNKRFTEINDKYGEFNLPLRRVSAFEKIHRFVVAVTQDSETPCGMLQLCFLSHDSCTIP